MSYGALMRWEWEGGTATPGTDVEEPAFGEPAGDKTHSRPQPNHGRPRPTRIASVSPVHSGGWQADGDEP